MFGAKDRCGLTSRMQQSAGRRMRGCSSYSSLPPEVNDPPRTSQDSRNCKIKLNGVRRPCSDMRLLLRFVIDRVSVSDMANVGLARSGTHLAGSTDWELFPEASLLFYICIG
jgi:hypothetical protein